MLEIGIIQSGIISKIAAKNNLTSDLARSQPTKRKHPAQGQACSLTQRTRNASKNPAFHIPASPRPLSVKQELCPDLSGPPPVFVSAFYASPLKFPAPFAISVFFRGKNSF